MIGYKWLHNEFPAMNGVQTRLKALILFKEIIYKYTSTMQVTAISDFLLVPCNTT